MAEPSTASSIRHLLLRRHPACGSRSGYSPCCLAGRGTQSCRGHRARLNASEAQLQRRRHVSGPTAGAFSSRSAAVVDICEVDVVSSADEGADEHSLEAKIEKVIYGCRFMTFLGIFGSLVGSVVCFLKGSGSVIDSFTGYLQRGGKIVVTLVEATDEYLLGTVMLVFGMGLYELFICNFDIAKNSPYGSNLFGLFRLPERPRWLEIRSVNELKTKLGHVIVMILLIGLFDKSNKVAICSTTDLLCFAASILLSASCLYLLSKLGSPNK